MSLYSYHIFMFPFTWEMADRKQMSFSEKTSIENFNLSKYSSWENIATPKSDEYKRELYNEKNFFYPFTHQALYDDSCAERIIRHFERKEPYDKDVVYNIHVVSGREQLYSLNIRSISLNLYGTGVGILQFYLENTKYPELDDILRINQFGRRIYSPFIDFEKGIPGTKNVELADFISIEGLNGSPAAYHEDFTSYHPDSFWKPACFINQLIKDFSEKMIIKPVIDDRMFVMCWYGNNKLSRMIGGNYEKFKTGDDWYRLLFVDGGSATCQNDALKEKLINEHTYQRWQKYGSLYGCTRYSAVFISENSDYATNVLLRTFRTMYVRMAELSLVQRASILKFSEQVTIISELKEKETAKLVSSVSDLYRQYIRFINKVYFSEITAQEQAIEIYAMIQDSMKIKGQVKELDEQIEELHSYVSMVEDQGRNTNIEMLTIISSVIIIPTLIVAFADMHEKKYWMPVVLAPIAAITVLSIRNKKSERQKIRMIYGVFALVFLLLLVLTLIS